MEKVKWSAKPVITNVDSSKGKAKVKFLIARNILTILDMPL